jgi:Fe-S cluster assembly protein SufD
MASFIENIEKEWGKLENFAIDSKEKRQDYLEKFKENGLPTRRDEDWKYTNTNFLNKIDFFQNYIKNNISEINSGIIKSQLIPDLDVELVVFVNGRFSEKLSSFLQSDNLKIIPFSNLEKEEHPRFEENFGKIINGNHRFENLNRALYSDGLFIEICENFKSERPIHILNIANCENSPVIVNHRNLIVSEENSSVEIINSYFSLGDFESIFNTASEISVGNNANLSFYNLQNDDGEKSHIFNITKSIIAKTSVFNDYTFSLSGKFIRNDLRSHLNGEHSVANFYGLYLADGNSLVDNHSFVSHEVPNCKSNEFYKGILDDKAKGVFNGKVLVKKDAQKTDALQQNRNIVLNDKAQINTKPELEIYADDVKCSHGATTGVIDRDALFYLRQRGIPKSKAKALLMFTFCFEIIDKIEIPEVKQYLSHIIQKRLNV